MDPAKKEEFKIKFMMLVVMLNIVILMYALAILLFFLLKGEMRFVAALCLFSGAIALSYLTWNRYKKTKEWLVAYASDQSV